MSQNQAAEFAGVRAVTFDAAHTIFHPNPSVGAIYSEVMAEHGLTYAEAELEAGFRRAFATTAKDLAILDGEARERSYWRHIVETSIEGLDPQPKDFDALFEDVWEAFARGDRWRVAEGAREALARLRERGYQVALLTNWDRRVRQVLEDTELTEAFDAAIISSEVGAEKPDRAIFDAATQALGRQPEEMLHVGDSLQHDIRGAEAAGWRAVRMLDPGDSDDTGGIKSVRSFAELLELL